MTTEKTHRTQLVIFDLDGTLLNTIDDLATATNHALRLHGYPEHELSEYRYFVGNGVRKLIERALPEESRQAEEITRLLKDFLEYYQLHKTDYSRPYTGIPEVLEQLHDAGIQLAVASNKYHQGTTELIRHYFKEKMFCIVLGQREGIPTKPNPAIVREILAHTSIPANATLYVGDSGVDMQTAANSGLVSIGVTWGFRPREELEANGAVHIIDHPAEIARIAGLTANL